MKRYLISIIVIVVALAMAWTVFAQEKREAPADEDARVRRPADVNRPAGQEQRHIFLGREEQLKVIATIEEQVTKLKTLVQAQMGPEEFAKMKELSEEERTKLREKFGKAREERQKAIEAIDQNLAKLRGGLPRAEEQQMLISELQAIRELATKEKAEQTSKRLEQLIDRRQRPRPERTPRRERTM